MALFFRGSFPVPFRRFRPRIPRNLLRCDEYRQLRLVFPEAPRFEQFPEDRDLSQQRHLGDVLRHLVLHQSGEHHGFPGRRGKVRGHPAGEESRDVGGAAAVVHRADFRLDLGPDFPTVDHGRVDPKDDAVGFPFHFPRFRGDDHDRDLPARKEGGLFAAFACQPGIGEDAGLPVGKEKVQAGFEVRSDGDRAARASCPWPCELLNVRESGQRTPRCADSPRLISMIFRSYWSRVFFSSGRDNLQVDPGMGARRNPRGSSSPGKWPPGR